MSRVSPSSSLSIWFIGIRLGENHCLPAWGGLTPRLEEHLTPNSSPLTAYSRALEWHSQVRSHESHGSVTSRGGPLIAQRYSQTRSSERSCSMSTGLAM